MEVGGHFEGGGVWAAGAQAIEGDDDGVAVAAVLGEFVLFVGEATLAEGAYLFAGFRVFGEFVGLGGGSIAGARNVAWFGWRTGGGGGGKVGAPPEWGTGCWRNGGTACRLEIDSSDEGFGRLALGALGGSDPEFDVGVGAMVHESDVRRWGSHRWSERLAGRFSAGDDQLVKVFRVGRSRA